MNHSNSNGGQVAVLGAGVSGLAAAQLLNEHGVQVRIFDKARGPAGRISTRHAEGFDFDHGAQYFTARDEAFRAFVQSLVEREVVAEWKGTIVRIDGAGRDRGPAKVSERYVGQPGMNAIAKHLAEGLDIVTRTRVAPLASQGSTTLRSEKGEDLGAYDRLLITVPAGQAAELIRDVDGRLAAVAEGVSMKPCRAVLLGFDQRVSVPFDGAFVDDSPLSWIARNSSKPGRPGGEAWVLHGSPDWSEEHFEETPEESMKVLEQAFQEVCGEALPATLHRDSHRWKYAIPDRVLEERFLATEDGRIALCGDWCAGPRVEGAWLSGIAAAKHLLSTL